MALLSAALVSTQRCKYDTCNCQDNEDCLCAALSSYALACAAKGIMLWGWRKQICSECPWAAQGASGAGSSAPCLMAQEPQRQRQSGSRGHSGPLS